MKKLAFVVVLMFAVFYGFDVRSSTVSTLHDTALSVQRGGSAVQACQITGTVNEDGTANENIYGVWHFELTGPVQTDPSTTINPICVLPPTIDGIVIEKIDSKPYVGVPWLKMNAADMEQWVNLGYDLRKMISLSDEISDEWVSVDFTRGAEKVSTLDTSIKVDCLGGQFIANQDGIVSFMGSVEWSKGTYDIISALVSSSMIEPIICDKIIHTIIGTRTSATTSQQPPTSQQPLPVRPAAEQQIATPDCEVVGEDTDNESFTDYTKITVTNDIDDAVGKWTVTISPDPVALGIETGERLLAATGSNDHIIATDITNAISIQLLLCGQTKSFPVEIEKNSAGKLMTRINGKEVELTVNPGVWSNDGKVSQRALFPVALDVNKFFDVECGAIAFGADGKAAGSGRWTLGQYAGEFNQFVPGSDKICESVLSKITLQKVRNAGIYKAAKVDHNKISGRWVIDIVPNAQGVAGGKGLLSGKSASGGTTCSDIIDVDLDMIYDQGKDELTLALYDTKVLIYSGTISEEIDMLSFPSGYGSDITLTDPMMDIQVADDGKLTISGDADASWKLADGTSCSGVVSMSGSKSVGSEPIGVSAPVVDPGSLSGPGSDSDPSTGPSSGSGDGQPAAGGKGSGGGGGCSLIIAR